MLSLKPTTRKEDNTEEENWQNVAEDTSKAMSLGIAVGTVASAILGGGLPIIVGTAVGGAISVMAAVYDLTRDYPGLTEEELACVEELETRRQRLTRKEKVLRDCRGCDELPRAGSDLKTCMKIRERLRDGEVVKPCYPCVPGETREPGEVCEDEHESGDQPKQSVHPKLAKRFNEFKPYQRSSHLKQFTSKPSESFWDNYVPAKAEKNAKPVPLKRFTTPSYRRNDEN